MEQPQQSAAHSNPNPPSNLNLNRWWPKAACRGVNVTEVKVRHCSGCPVANECMWTAILEDDRITEHPLFVRGGLSATRREQIWIREEHDPMATYAWCRMEAKAIEQRRRKVKANK